MNLKFLRTQHDQGLVDVSQEIEMITQYLE